jgi:hypothetical protein
MLTNAKSSRSHCMCGCRAQGDCELSGNCFGRAADLASPDSSFVSNLRSRSKSVKHEDCHQQESCFVLPSIFIHGPRQLMVRHSIREKSLCIDYDRLPKALYSRHVREHQPQNYDVLLDGDSPLLTGWMSTRVAIVDALIEDKCVRPAKG